MAKLSKSLRLRKAISVSLLASLPETSRLAKELGIWAVWRRTTALRRHNQTISRFCGIKKALGGKLKNMFLSKKKINKLTPAIDSWPFVNLTLLCHIDVRHLNSWPNQYEPLPLLLKQANNWYSFSATHQIPQWLPHIYELSICKNND